MPSIPTNLVRNARNVIRYYGRALSGKPLYILALTPVVLIALLPRPAGALMAETISFLGAVLNSFLAVIIGLEATIIQWLIAPSTFQYVTNEAVQRAWVTVRDFVNLGFVLAIVVIAIGFILRTQSYGSVRTLSRLIIAALMVNFSLVIAGVFIDASALLSSIFLQSMDINTIGDQIIRATGIVDFFNTSEGNPWWSKVIGFILRLNPIIDAIATINALTKVLFATLFAIIMIATLAALIVMLVVRTVRLWFLLIIAPIAWFSWIFPALEKNWRKWWDEFLRWTFFAPIVIFFLVVSLTIISGQSTGPNPPPEQPQGFLQRFVSVLRTIWRNAINQMEPVNATIVRFALAIILIIFSMIVANDLSITFADTGLKWATGIAKWPGLTAWRTGIREGRRRFAASDVGRSLEQRLSAIPFAGGLADLLRAQRQDYARAVAAARERFRQWTRDEMNDFMTNDRTRTQFHAMMADRPAFLGFMQEFASKGGRIPEAVRDVAFARLHAIDPRMAEEMLPSNLDYVEQYEQEIAGRRENPRPLSYYSSRMTPEQAAAVDLDQLHLTNQEVTQFALSIRQAVLAHLFEHNVDLAQRIVHEIQRPIEELQQAGVGLNEINRARGMLNSPMIAAYIMPLHHPQHNVMFE